MVEYPVFDVPYMGGSMLIAAVAIFHVFIAHFSVGAGFFMAVAERRAIRLGDTDTIGYLKKYSFMVLLIPYVLGTVSGVGIWFTIALVNPRATSLLIHQFVWDWAIEWVLFITEIVSVYIYVFYWDKMSPRIHNRIGWIFALCSAGTLLVINAILSFMLTPGRWQPFDSGLLHYKALLNPSFFPTTIGRFAISLAFAGVGGVVLAAIDRKTIEKVRKTITAQAYKFMLPTIICVPVGLWVFSVLPGRSQNFLLGGAPAMVLFLSFGMASFVILFFAALVSLIRRDYNPSTLGALLLCLLGFVSFGAMEFVREGLRKPYVIEGFMYSTGVTAPEFSEIDSKGNLVHTSQAGILSAAPWALPMGTAAGEMDTVAIGESVFRAACLRCHSVDGYNAIRPLVKGWSADTIRDILDKCDEIKPAMPPFPGTDKEKEALTVYLLSLDTRSPK